MARFRHKHVLRTRRPHRGRLVRIGLAAAAVPTLAVPAAAIIWSEAPLADMSMTRTAADRARTSPGPMRVATPLDAESPVQLAEESSDHADQGATHGREARARRSDKARTLGAVKWADKVADDGRTKAGPTEVVVGTERVPVEEPATATTKPIQEAGSDDSSHASLQSVPASPTKTATKSTGTSTTTKKKPASTAESTAVVTTTTKPAPDPEPAPMPPSTTSPTTSPSPTPMPTDAPSADPTALPTDTCTTSPDAPLGPTGPVVDPETCLPLP